MDDELEFTGNIMFHKIAGNVYVELESLLAYMRAGNRLDCSAEQLLYWIEVGTENSRLNFD